MPLSDILVLLVTLAGTTAAVLQLRRSGARGRRLLAAGWLCFYGILVCSMMSAHSIEILYHVYAGHTTFAGSPWTYDFRTYALLLLGAVLFWPGARCLAEGLRLGRGAPGALREAARATAVVLAVSAPLIPIHGVFGIMYTVLSTAGLLVLAASRSLDAGPTPSRPETHEAEPAGA